MTIGDRIKQKRLECGYSVDELAAKLHKSKATIYRYESGDIASMPFSALHELAAALNTTTPELMGWNEENRKYLEDARRELEEEDKNVPVVPTSLEEKQKSLTDLVVEYVNRLDKSQLERIYHYVQALYDLKSDK